MDTLCATCTWAPTSLSVASIILMAKVFGRTLASAAVIVIIGAYLSIRWLFAMNEEPAVLTGYPEDKELQKFLVVKNSSESRLCQPPLSTAGRYILNSNGTRCKLISVNWYGASDEHMVPGGLDFRHREDIAKTIRDLGFNSVRLPYADEIVRKNPIIAQEHLAANADLVGLRALDIYYAVVKALTSSGIAVIVNNHITQARWCCDANLCDGKWTNSWLGPLCPIRQTEEDWIRNLETIMGPHVDDPLVIGVDLRNEIRGITDNYLWYSWADAAESASNRLHLIQPNWLMVVEGVSSANDLSGVRKRPVHLVVPNKLVYSSHVYGWSGWGSLEPYWKSSYNRFVQAMEHNWGFLLHEDIAPVWVGEFGAPDRPNKGDLNYWTNLVHYLREVDADFGYWAINPRKPHNNTYESYGLLQDDWKTPRYDYRLYDMIKLAQIPDWTTDDQELL